MKNLYGLTNIKTQLISCNRNDVTESVNKFIMAHDGEIIDIKYSGQLCGFFDILIIYHEKEKTI